MAAVLWWHVKRCQQLVDYRPPCNQQAGCRLSHPHKRYIHEQERWQQCSGAQPATAVEGKADGWQCP